MVEILLIIAAVLGVSYFVAKSHHPQHCNCDHCILKNSCHGCTH